MVKFKKKQTLTSKEKWLKNKGMRKMKEEEVLEIARARLSQMNK